jgi:hypothetical protein
MKRPPILVADAVHFSPRKFQPLYDFAAESGIRILAEKSRAAWWDRADGYRGLADRLVPHRQSLQSLSPAELTTHRYRGIDVFACARNEIVRLLLRRWTEPWPETDGEVAARAIACAGAREATLLCLAATRDWIDFWHQFLDHNRRPHCAVAYRTSAIHSRSLLEVASRQGIHTFVADRFSTGRHYFFDEWRPSADRPLLADPGWYGRLALPPDPAARERARAAAHRQLTPIRAAVAARSASEDLAAPIDAPKSGIAVVLGQLINDPSLLEAPRHRPASPAIYRRLIAGLLGRTDLAVALLVDAPPIARLLRTWRDTLTRDQRARFRIAEAAPLEVLFSQARWVVSLSAPLALEACRAGLKPVQFAPTALSGKNFTHDFAGPDDFLGELSAGRIDGGLTLAEYRAFEDFLVRLLLLHLLPEGDRGVAEIAARLAERNHVPMLRRCDFYDIPRASLWPTLIGALANPTAALRLAGAWALRDQD